MNLLHRDEDLGTSFFCVRVKTIPLFLGVANYRELSFHALNMKTANLHATVDLKVYGRVPRKLVSFLLELYPMMAKHQNRDGSVFFKVNKASYGLTEASRLWFLHLTGLLAKLEYKTAIHDKGVLYQLTPDGIVLI